MLRCARADAIGLATIRQSSTAEDLDRSGQAKATTPSSASTTTVCMAGA